MRRKLYKAFQLLASGSRKVFGLKLFLIFIAIVFTGYSITASEIDKKKRDDLYKQVRLFSDSLTIIQTDYVDDVTTKKLIYGALKGMLSSLDPHSQFMDPDTYNELKVDTGGKFGGLGIEITIKDGLLTVITPIEDTPAWKAGIKSNDRIVKIDNGLTRDITISEAVKKLRGKPGTTVNISVLRESEKKILEFKIIRDIIKIKDIKEARILENGIGYIRLTEFMENTPKDFSAALENLSKSNMNSLILDIRNNPGGLLDVAVRVTEKFLEKGKLIVSTKDKKTVQNLKIFSQAANPILNLPMVILINEGSASASEIVAGCLQDYKRAIIVGIKSFGKSSVQTVIPLYDGSALKLTTSKYFTPAGREIHGKGIVPDIIIEEAKIETEKNKDQKPEDVFEKVEQKEKPEKPKKEEKTFDYKTDNQLNRAVDILKAIRIYKETK
ncbi:MAG: S41 family peptidase [Candidatus Omnitrophota bacterium]|nr:S41 family peptidase [Candidatus Omnitrophota bacterium]